MVDAGGKLFGIVSEGDFVRHAEIGTQRKHGWSRFLLGPGSAAGHFVREQGRKVGGVMTQQPFTVSEDTSLEDIVDLMEKNNVKRLPVTRGDRIVGIVSRLNLPRAVAGLAREVRDPTAGDDHVRDRIIAIIENNDWMSFELNVIVHNGVVHLNGVNTEHRSRKAATVAENVAGVQEVHDHLCWVEPMSRLYLNSAEVENVANAGTFG